MGKVSTNDSRHVFSHGGAWKENGRTARLGYSYWRKMDIGTEDQTGLFPSLLSARPEGCQFSGIDLDLRFELRTFRTYIGSLSSPLTLQMDVPGWAIVTGSRVVFCVPQFEAHTEYLGTGLGALVATGATAVSKQRAQTRQRDRVIAGHLYLDTVTRIESASKRGGPLGGGALNDLQIYGIEAVTFPGEPRELSVRFGIEGWTQIEVHSVAHWLARCIAIQRKDRLIDTDMIEGSDNVSLRELAEGRTPETRAAPDGAKTFASYTLPGATAIERRPVSAEEQE